jgi:release factor glutamine methyltransferase
MSTPAVPLSHILERISHDIFPVYTNRQAAYSQAWVILEFITGMRKADLIVQGSLTLGLETKRKLEHVIALLRDQAMPLAYIVGSAPFLDLTLEIKPPVLIPRPETEEWCAQLITHIAPFVARANSYRPFRVLDLCTGSGCIALALAMRFKDYPVKIIGVDNAEHALACARANSHRYQLANVHFKASDLYKELFLEEPFDLIVANPPYISQSEYALLDPSVSLWEDRQALIAHDNGLGIVKEIISQAPAYLRSTYSCAELWCEISYCQGEEALKLYAQAGFTAVTLLQDIAQRDRTIKGAFYDLVA